MTYVVDTNVGVVANDRAEDDHDPHCVLRCTEALERAARNIVLIDDGMRILTEYRRHLSMDGQPGLGDAFLKWVWDRQADPSHVVAVPITPRAEDDRDFDEFPRDSELESFDPADRKFVAVALGSRTNPTVLNATDSDWWEHRAALARNGVRVEFVCPDEFA